MRLMIRSTAQQRHCCCLRKQVPQQSGQHADLVNCAQRARKKRIFDAFAKCGKKNLHAGTERVRMAPRRKTVTDRGLLKQGVGSVLFCYKRVNRSRKWNALKEATIWTSNKFDGVKLSSYLPVIPKL